MPHCVHIMTNPWLNFLAITFYIAAGVVGAWRLLSADGATKRQHFGILALSFGAILLHGAILTSTLQLDVGLNLSLTAAFSLVAWIVAALYFAAALYRPVDTLGILVMPLAALTMLVAWIWPTQQAIGLFSHWQAAHIVISLLAYSLLCLAAVQSLLLLVQERELRHKHRHSFMQTLPPMETTETLMFQMIGLGFVLLTLTVISGVVFAEVLFGKPFRWTHHVILSLSGWVVYAILLVGRWRLGWRGRAAVRWTLGGFVLLVLAYFGSKFVLEVLLQRG